MHKFWKYLGAAAGIYGLACGALLALMMQPPARFAAVVGTLPAPVMFLAFPFETLWKTARAGRLPPGTAAPDFDLPVLDGQARVRLSAFRGVKPVVLIFGSYT